MGQDAEPKVQQPGQSLVEPAPIKMPPASTTEKKRLDILMDPERINTIENKNPTKDNTLPPCRPRWPVSCRRRHLAERRRLFAGPAALHMRQNPNQPGAYNPGQTGGFNPQTVNVPNPQIPGNWPLGAQSVLAAKNGNMNGTTFVPVPVATVPNPARMPSPPEPKLPDPPAPNTWVNAFTPPAKQQQEQQTLQNTMGQQMGGQPRHAGAASPP